MQINSLKNPGAWIPMAMSLTAVLMIAGHVLIFGQVHETDEGSAAHVFQLLMALQGPFVIWHFIRFLPIDRRRAIGVSSLQAGLALVAISAVWILT